MKQTHRRLIYIATLVAAMVGTLDAAVITDTYAGSLPATFTGTLPDQASVFLETFTLAAPSNVTVFTTSYATGGFQTNLLLFNSLGLVVTGSIPAGSPDIGTGITADSSLTALGLAAGMYTVALTDFLLGQPITATNITDGFTFNIGNGTTFIDAGDHPRTGNYSFTISAANASAVPEPGTIWMLAPIALWGALRSKKYFI